MYYSKLIAFRCAIFDCVIAKFSEKPTAHVALYFWKHFMLFANCTLFWTTCTCILFKNNIDLPMQVYYCCLSFIDLEGELSANKGSVLIYQTYKEMLLNTIKFQRNFPLLDPWTVDLEFNFWIRHSKSQTPPLPQLQLRTELMRGIASITLNIAAGIHRVTEIAVIRHVIVHTNIMRFSAHYSVNMLYD